MAQTGKFIFNNFYGKAIEFIMDFNSEWIEYADHTSINDTILSGVVQAYDEETGIITFMTINEGQEFYIAEDSITLFWEKGKYNFLRHAQNVYNTGRKYLKKDRDIM